LYSASYARLKNIGVSYSLPTKWLKALSLETVKFRITGENLVTLYGHEGLDPEQTVSGSTYYRYPAQKVCSFGVDVSF